MQLRRRFSNALLAGALCLASAFSVSPTPARADQNTDDQLAKVFEAIENNHLDLAFKDVEALIEARPNFRLAYLIKGDLLLARSRPIKTFGDAPKGSSEQRLNDLRAEALARQEFDWTEQASAVRAKRFGRMPPRDIRERAKQVRFLEYRGFAADQIRQVLKHNHDLAD